MTRFGRLHRLTLLALPLILLALFACGSNGDTSEDTSTATGADETSSAGASAATQSSAAETSSARSSATTRSGAQLTTEEYVAAMEEIATIGDDEFEEALEDFLFNGVFSDAEAERIRSLEASDSWSDDDADFASQTRETLLQAVTDLYDFAVSIFNTILDEMSSLRPPDHLSDLHDNYIATAREVVQLLQTQIETVKNTDTEVKNREEFAAFQAIVNSLESGPLDPALQQKAEELRAQADAACLALKGPLESELGRSVTFCDAEGSDASSADTSAGPAQDRAALIALYNATDGPNWTNNDNWLSDEPLGEWYGVETYTDGRVATLELFENGLRGELPAELAQLSDLEDLDLRQNNLSGEIPPELGQLSRLYKLSLWENSLSGEIPPELGQLSNLTRLYLGGNDLSGGIPPELGQLSRLYELSLWENSLSGEIPPELGQLSSLARLYLNGNDLSGEVPPELGQLTRLKHLTLPDNNLAGEIPVELGQLSDLVVLYLDGNEFTGCVPGAWRDVQENDLEELGLPFC